MLKLIYDSLKELRGFGLFFLLFLFVYALIGMNLFGYKVSLNSDYEQDFSENGSYID